MCALCFEIWLKQAGHDAKWNIFLELQNIYMTTIQIYFIKNSKHKQLANIILISLFSYIIFSILYSFKCSNSQAIRIMIMLGRVRRKLGVGLSVIFYTSLSLGTNYLLVDKIMNTSSVSDPYPQIDHIIRLFISLYFH